MKRVVIALSVLLIFTNTFAQEPPVEIKKSTEKVIIDGKKYLLHFVQQGQTAYSISKAYGVSLQDIAAANRSIVLEQIQPGQILRIPVSDDADIKDELTLGLSEDDFIIHQVKQGETVFSLSQRYKAPIEVIYRLNPGTEAGIKVNQTIRIPRKKVMKDVIENVRDYDNYYYYEVKKKDTLYSLSKNYGVTVADIIENNPELRWGLKSGMTIKIPKFTRFIEDTTRIFKDTLPEEFVIVPLTAVECDSIRKANFIKSVNVLVMLPFFADYTLELKKTIEDTSYVSDDPAINASIKRGAYIKGDYYFEFYEGILMALDTLRKTGLDIKLMVYDTERDSNRVKKILTELKNKKIDLIIGPVFPEPFKVAARYADSLNIHIISPIYSRSLQLNGFTHAFQFIPSRESEFQSMAKVALSYSQSNLLFIHDADTSNKRDFEYLNHAWFELINDTSNKPHLIINEILFSDTLFLNIKKRLKTNQKNLVIITSNNEAYVSELLSFLDRNLRSHDITVIGQSSWLTFNNIDLEYYHNLELILITPFYIDYKNNSTNQFLKKAINMLGFEPLELRSKGYNLTFLGYDVAFYFIRSFSTFGKDFHRCSCCIDINTLLNKYTFVQKKPNNGFENTGMIYLKFHKDFTVRRFFPQPIKNKSNTGIK